MAGEFDPQEFAPDDLETERLCDSDPQLRRLWVKKCQAQRDAYPLAGTAGFRAERQGYRSDAPVVSPTESAEVWSRLQRAKQELKEYCDKRGLPDLSEPQ
jgi:hypothetical protein